MASIHAPTLSRRLNIQRLPVSLVCSRPKTSWRPQVMSKHPSMWGHRKLGKGFPHCPWLCGPHSPHHTAGLCTLSQVSHLHVPFCSSPAACFFFQWFLSWACSRVPGASGCCHHHPGDHVQRPTVWSHLSGLSLGSPYPDHASLSCACAVLQLDLTTQLLPNWASAASPSYTPLPTTGPWVCLLSLNHF